MISSLQQYVPGSLANWAPVCWPGCQSPRTAPTRVREDRHAARLHHIHRASEDGAAVGGHLGHGGVGAVDVDVGHPDRWHVGVHLRAEPRHGLPAQVADRITTGLRRSLRAVPAEERPVELLRLRQVGAAQIHPGWDSVFVALELHSAFSPSPTSRQLAPTGRRYLIDVAFARAGGEMITEVSQSPAAP